LYRNVKPTTFILGYIDVKWKILEETALQISGSEELSLKPMYAANFRAIFGYVKD
jgi:hypothetical protein